MQGYQPFVAECSVTGMRPSMCNDIIQRALRGVDIPSALELSGLFRPGKFTIFTTFMKLTLFHVALASKHVTNDFYFFQIYMPILLLIIIIFRRYEVDTGRNATPVNENEIEEITVSYQRSVIAYVMHYAAYKPSG